MSIPRLQISVKLDQKSGRLLDCHTWYRIRFSRFSFSVEQASVLAELKNCLLSQEIVSRIGRIPNNQAQSPVVGSSDPEIAAERQ
jgi:hypothetical protein